MSIRCWFRQCDWVWLANAERPHFRQKGEAPRVGLYRCSRCKALSIGARRWMGWVHGEIEDKQP